MEQIINNIKAIFRSRHNLVLFLIVLIGMVIVGRLFFLQIIRHDYYGALAHGQQKFFIEVKGDRGEIFFKNGEALAINVKKKYVYISPRKIDKKVETAEALSQILDLDKEYLLEKTEKDNLFERLKSKLTEQEIDSLEKADLAGVYLEEEVCRDYPQKFFASQLVGFLGGNNIGQYGLEEQWNDVLSGKQGVMEGEKGPQGSLFFSFLEKNKIKKGADIILTIDYDVQYFAEKLLKEASDNLDIQGGTIIVANPHSGRILALANFPNFDPNEYSKESNNFRIFLNGATQEVFEPGSVFKPITMAPALNEGKLTPQSTFIDPGVVNIGRWPIYNYEQRIYPGDITMTEVLEKSINTGAVFVESQVGHNIFLDYIKRFGIFEKTGIDLPGEIISSNGEIRKGYEISFATASFGQGIAMTPIQLIRAFSAIANGGKMVKPFVVDKIIQQDKIIETQPETISENVISSKTASQLTAMLVSVVENGFGKKAKVPGYLVAGKTGTAQVAWSAIESGIVKAGYSEETIQSFIGFAPAFNSQFLILVKLSNPKTKTAEYSAMPIFQKLAEYILGRYHIQPDY